MTGVLLDVPAVRPAAVDPSVRALAARLPARLRLGTCSWSFPGWRGQVWADDLPADVLARDGLAAYAAHPLLRAVSVDRSYYGPVDARTWTRWAQAVPDDFRFTVKGPAAILRPRRDGRPDPGFLDIPQAHAAIDAARAGLGSRLGAMVWQLSPGTVRRGDDPAPVVAALGRFLAALPRDVPHAVEVRDPGLLVPAWADALRAAGATPALTVFPGMPTLRAQARFADAVGGGLRVVRWMLHPAWTYAAARDAFTPFAHTQAVHPAIRDDLAAVVAAALDAARDVIVLANNKAEGSAPASLQALAERLAPRAPNR